MLEHEYVSVRDTDSEYTFIKPLLFQKVPEEAALPQYSSLKQAITDYAQTAQKDPTIHTVSIYYRNLDTSQWVGVNTDERYSPGSMLKVVTLMSVLHAAEKNPTFLSKKLSIKSGDSLPTAEQTEYPPKDPIRAGTVYTVAELLTHLIQESDNVANYMLLRTVSSSETLDIYKDLGLPEPTGERDTYTAQEYSRIFRVLYNGTYLSHEASEQALSLLSATSFAHGIVAGLPSGTMVAHKFGIRSITNEQGDIERELHDCGIVYYPEQPYFICVMTRGESFKELESVLSEASRIVWEEVHTRNKPDVL
jgi:beta-lactamase class A